MTNKSIVVNMDAWLSNICQKIKEKNVKILQLIFYELCVNVVVRNCHTDQHRSCPRKTNVFMFHTKRVASQGQTRFPCKSIAASKKQTPRGIVGISGTSLSRLSQSTQHKTVRTLFKITTQNLQYAKTWRVTIQRQQGRFRREKE